MVEWLQFYDNGVQFCDNGGISTTCVTWAPR